MATLAALSGTRCSFLAFMRSAGTVHTAAERDRHTIAAEIQRLAAERQAAQITGEDDG